MISSLHQHYCLILRVEKKNDDGMLKVVTVIMTVDDLIYAYEPVSKDLIQHAIRPFVNQRISVNCGKTTQHVDSVCKSHQKIEYFSLDWRRNEFLSFPKMKIGIS